MAYHPLSRARDYQNLFDSDLGRRVLMDLLRQGHFFEPTYVRSDAHESSFREGERNLTLYVLAQLKLNQAELMQLIQENRDASEDWTDADPISGVSPIR